MIHADSMTATKVAVTGFGAALASMGAASSADASIVELSFSPGSFIANSRTDAYFQTSAGGTVSGHIQVSNSTSVDFITSAGATISTRTNNVKDINPRAGLTFAELMLGDVVDATALGSSLFLGRGGERYFGFSSADGKLGWFLYDFGTSRTSGTSFVQGYINTTAGGAINVGQTQAVNAVPVPAALPLFGTGLLAMGAVGIRRRRKERQAA